MENKFLVRLPCFFLDISICAAKTSETKWTKLVHLWAQNKCSCNWQIFFLDKMLIQG